MEKQEKVVVKINELPVRAEKLSLEEASNLFGGCASSGEWCESSCDCCSETCIGGSRGAGLCT